MRHLALLAAIVWLAGCGKHEATHTGAQTNPTVEHLYTVYSKLAPRGWDADTSCDGLLFDSLTAAALHESFDITRARNDVGRWDRRPIPDPCGASSRDMHYGLWTYAYELKDTAILDGEWDYAVAHAWVMDDRGAAVSTLLPDDAPTLAQLEYKAGGHDHFQRTLPVTCLKGLQGFEAHLQVVKIMERALAGAGNTADDACAAAYAASQPRNAFFAAVHGLYTGDQSAAQTLLSTGTVCPLDRLPTTADRCEPWLWQRDDNSEDWKPCQVGPTSTHSGGDCLIAAALALGKL